MAKNRPFVTFDVTSGSVTLSAGFFEHERVEEELQEPTLAQKMELGRKLALKVRGVSSWEVVDTVKSAVKWGAALNCKQVGTILRNAPSFVQQELAAACLPAVYDRYNWAEACDAVASFNRAYVRSLL